LVDVDGPLFNIKNTAAEISRIGIMLSSTSLDIRLTRKVPTIDPAKDKKKNKYLLGSVKRPFL
jgi:hypothetical protein